MAQPSAKAISPLPKPTTSREDMPINRREFFGSINSNPIETWRLISVLACCGVGLLLALMDATVVATMLLDISKDLGGFKNVQWVVLSYTLLEAGLCVTLTRLSDIFGRKTVICSSFGVFLVASMACGASKSLDLLIGFRALQGAGGAGLYATSLVIYLEMAPPRRAMLMCTIMGFIVALAGVMGPIVGGLLATYAEWRYAFWINGPCSLVPGVLLFFIWPKTKRGGIRVQTKYLDYLGAFLVMAGTVLPIYITNQSAIGEYDWQSAITITVLILSALAWILLLLWQREVSRQTSLSKILSQLPWDILANRVMVASLLDTVLASFVMFVAVFHIPIRAQVADFNSPIKSATLLLPLLASTAVGAGMSGIISCKRNLTFFTLTLSNLLMIVGSVLFLVLPGATRSRSNLWGYEVIVGFGAGMNVATTTIVAALHVEPQYHAVAQGLIAQMRIFGGSIGVSSSFIVLHCKIQSRMSGVIGPQQLRDYYSSPLTFISLSPQQLLIAREAYIVAFEDIMRLNVIVSAVCLAVSLCSFQSHPPSILKKIEELEDYFN